jgi:ribonuclease D
MKLISSDVELGVVVEALRGAKVLFIDTEFDASRKQTTLSVIQVGRGEEIFLLDALALADLTVLGDVMVRDDVEWVLHAGLQDVELLLERFRKPKPPKLFDTQIAWALLGPESSVSLAYIQYHVLGLRTMKTHQADDWMRRPLPEAQLRYAASDIEHLPVIYKTLSDRLEAANRSHLVAELCHELLWPKPELPSRLTLESFRNAWQLHPNNQAALLFLMTWYNDLPGWERDRVPQAKTLLSIASRMPRNAADLMRIKGVPPNFNRAHADNIVRGIHRAVREVLPEQFVQIDPPPYATFEDIRLDAWLSMVRAEVSATVKIAPDLLLPQRLMRDIKEKVAASGNKRDSLVECLEGWRKVVLLPAIEPFLQEVQ